MRLHLVRHPEPALAQGVCYGRSDVPVAEERMTAVAGLLAPRLPAGLPLHSSPAARCAGLARRLADMLGSGPVRFDPRLMEMDFGAWEMLSWNAIPRAEIDAWAADMPAYRPGGGERVLDVAARVMAFRRQLAAEGSDAIVVCHAGVIRLLLAALENEALEAIAAAAARMPHRIGYGELVTVDCRP